MTAPLADLHEVRFLPLRPADRLEVALTFGLRCGDEGVLLFGPQPFLGGDMDNNVIVAMARAFATAAHPAFRFNYRSVGQSEPATSSLSRYDYWNHVMTHGRPEDIDADCDEAFVRASRLFRPVLFGGYSFGAHAALRFARRHDLATPLVLVAPPMKELDFNDLTQVKGRALLVFASDDTLDPAPPRDQIARRFPAVRFCELAGADHFFRGCEEHLGQTILEHLGWSCETGPPETIPCWKS